MRILGLAAMVYLLLGLFRQLWPTARVPEEAWPGQRELARGFLAAFTGLLVNMLTVTAVRKNVNSAHCGLHVSMLHPVSMA